MQLLTSTLSIDDIDTFVATLGDVGDQHGTTIQAFDARYVAGTRHLERAVSLADRSLERGDAIARNRAVEILLSAAGRRQITRALEMGVEEGETDAVILIDGGDETAAREALESLEAVEDLAVGTQKALRGETAAICSFFSITAEERAATDATLESLVCERVALLELEK